MKRKKEFLLMLSIFVISRDFNSLNIKNNIFNSVCETSQIYIFQNAF